MKLIGIVRKLDRLNRLVIPKELCNEFELGDGTPMEVFVDGQDIILRKYQPGCIFCDSVTNISYIKGKPVCQKCRNEVKGV